MCPCANNDETDQPDPLCSKCHGIGWFYFAPVEACATDPGELTPVQRAIIDVSDSVVIKGLTQRSLLADDPYTGHGNWRTGQLHISVRGENKLGFYDKLVNLDREICYFEVIRVGSLGTPIKLRYKAAGINTVQTVDTVYQIGREFNVTPQGVLEFDESVRPAEGERLSVHYVTHPTYLVINYPHAHRGTTTLRKRLPKMTPTGNPQVLPIQAEIRLEFVPDSSE